MKNRNKVLKISILLYSCMQMSMLGISSVITELIKNFPNCSASVIQFLTTFPDIIIAFTAILCGKLIDQIGKRKLIILSGALFLITAIGGFFVHQSIWGLLLWSCTLGIAIGILIPTIIAILNEEIEENKSEMIGLQNSAISFGGIIVILFAGILATIHWYYCYLTYLLVLPGFVGLFFTLENRTKKHEIEKHNVKINWNITIAYSILDLLFFSFYNAIPTNIALLLTENGIDSTVKASFSICMLLLGSALSGVVFHKIYTVMYQDTILLGLSLLGCGVFILSNFVNYIVLLIGMLIAGTSLSLVMAATTAIILDQKKAMNTNMIIAIIMAASDCGGFLSPVYTGLSGYVFQRNSAENRFRMIFVLLLFIVIILLFKKMIKQKMGGKP